MENKSAIGLSWALKLSPISSGTKKSSEKALALQPGSVWKPETELVDGLYVPHRDTRKLNKLMNINTTDTAGQSWFDMPAPTITLELKKDLEILKLRNVIDPKKFFKKGENTKDLPSISRWVLLLNLHLSFSQVGWRRQRGRPHLLMSCSPIQPLRHTGNARWERLKRKITLEVLRNEKTKVIRPGSVRSKEGDEPSGTTFFVVSRLPALGSRSSKRSR